jgi:hypothetical protein
MFNSYFTLKSMFVKALENLNFMLFRAKLLGVIRRQAFPTATTGPLVPTATFTSSFAPPPIGFH